jgi:ribosomal protein S8
MVKIKNNQKKITIILSSQTILRIADIFINLGYISIASVVIPYFLDKHDLRFVIFGL